uniref:Uncharacterized protein n=1 Tax=Anopheles aquasalis TaxID=42839 RepID=T1DGY8_ANOAQ
MPCRTCGKDCKCLRMMSKRGCGCRPCDSDCTCSCNTSSSKSHDADRKRERKTVVHSQSVTADGGVGCCCSSVIGAETK